MPPPERLRAIVEDAIKHGIGLHWSFFVRLPVDCRDGIASGIEAYMAARRRTLATKQDLLEIVAQVRQTTAAT